MDRLRTAVPLLASHRELVEREGPLGRAWFAPGRRLRAGAPPDRHARRTKAMRIYYIDESEGPRYYVRSALGVDAERWNGPAWPHSGLAHGVGGRLQRPDKPGAARLRPAGRSGQAGPHRQHRPQAHPGAGSRDLHGRPAHHRERRPFPGRHRGRQRLPAQGRRQGLRARQPGPAAQPHQLLRRCGRSLRPPHLRRGGSG